MKHLVAASLVSALALAGCTATPAYAPSTGSGATGITWSNPDPNAKAPPPSDASAAIGQGIKWTDPVSGAPAPDAPVTAAPLNAPAPAAPPAAASAAPAPAPMGQGIQWSNPPAGNAVAAKPPAGARECREFQRTIIIDGKPETAFGTACRQPDGTWRIQP
jgi:hypothetical protein